MPLKVNAITVQHAASLRTYRLQYRTTTVHITIFPAQSVFACCK